VAISPAAPRLDLDQGATIVLADASGPGSDTLAWAAAEAATRDSELKIVRALGSSWSLDPTGNPAEGTRRIRAANSLVDAAERYVRSIAPSLQVTRLVTYESPAAALLNQARKESDSQPLVVLDHGRRSGRTGQWQTRQLLHRTTAAIATIGLAGHITHSPSAGRIVVAADDMGGHREVLGYAFRAARRRGTGLTVVHGAPSATPGLTEAMGRWMTAYPEVAVQLRHPTSDVAGAVVAESAGAALTVLGLDRNGRLRRNLRSSLAGDVQRLAQGPVVLVGVGAAA
jgi:hypothetical protein